MHSQHGDELSLGQNALKFNAHIESADDDHTIMVAPESDAGHDSAAVLKLDFQALKARRALVPGHDFEACAREFRRIKRQILLRRESLPTSDFPNNFIFITSALPGEGKTFIALNLALSLALERDYEVLLVDVDVAKRGLSKQLGIAERPGFVDLITHGRSMMRLTVLRTNIEGLSVMSCGSQDRMADELFASKLTQDTLAQIAGQNPKRLIVFDGPPILPVTDTVTLARRMSQTILVVEANKTPVKSVQEAAERLEGCNGLSILLNKASAGPQQEYGYEA